MWPQSNSSGASSGAAQSSLTRADSLTRSPDVANTPLDPHRRESINVAAASASASHTASAASSSRASKNTSPSLAPAPTIVQHMPPSLIPNTVAPPPAQLHAPPSSQSTAPQPPQQHPLVSRKQSKSKGKSAQQRLAPPKPRTWDTGAYDQHSDDDARSRRGSSGSKQPPAPGQNSTDDSEEGDARGCVGTVAAMPPSRRAHDDDSGSDPESTSGSPRKPSGMRASSSSSALSSAAAAAAAGGSSSSSARKDSKLRKTIGDGMKGLSSSALRSVEAFVKQLAKAEAAGGAGEQVEGKSSAASAMLSAAAAGNWSRADSARFIAQPPAGGGGSDSDTTEGREGSSDDADADELPSVARSTAQPTSIYNTMSSVSRTHSQAGQSQHPSQSHHGSGVPLSVLPSPGALPSLGMQRSWNQEFQSCFGAICNDSTILDNVAGYSALSSLAHDFVWTATTLGRIIISEMQLPPSQKTIPASQTIGGIAGGIKYLAHNILFKFAVDGKGLYGGDGFASKAAGHELLGLSNYYRSIASAEGRLGLCVPLAALIDFRGYRLYAICKLPIAGASTLVLGSGDAGQSVHNSSPALNEKMLAVATMLNLRPHRVRDPKSGCDVTLPSCFDIEGHLGKDGRYYLVDFHRTFPPEPPPNIIEAQARREEREIREATARARLAEENAVRAREMAAQAGAGASKAQQDSAAALGVAAAAAWAAVPRRLFSHLLPTAADAGPPLQNSYLYRLLRPELVRQHSTPLSSDAYSHFDNVADGHQTAVLDCYRNLLSSVIPSFAAQLEKHAPPKRFVDSQMAMAQQTANMIRTSSGGAAAAAAAQQGGPGAAQSSGGNGAQGYTPRMSRSPSMSSMVGGGARDSDYNLSSASAAQHASDSPPPASTAPPTLSLDVLSSVLHQSGINVRYLGLVRSHMSCPSWRSILLVEILARVLKNQLRARWRSIRLKSMSDGPFRSVAVQFLNLVFFPSLASSTYWHTHIHRAVNVHFPATFTGAESDPKTFDLKGSLQPKSAAAGAAQPPSSPGGAMSGGGRDRAASDPLHFGSCPVHHPAHTHTAVDPADPLSFLPPISAALSSAAAAAAGMSPPNSVPTSSAAAASSSSASASSSSSPEQPHLGRSPSLPTGLGGVALAPSLAGRSVSTSVGYVRQASHLPSSRSNTSLHHTQQQGTAGPGHHHSHSASLGTQPPPVSITAPHTPKSTRAHGGSMDADSSPGTSGASGRKPTNPHRPVDILQVQPDVRCPGLGCCTGGGQVDYLLLLFLRVIQLSGVVLEEGITEAIQQAADKQQSEAELLQRSDSVGSGDDVDPVTLARQESLNDDMAFPAMDGSSMVGEGSLQVLRSAHAASGHSHRNSMGSASGLAIAPNNRAVTEPRGMDFPPTPPALKHAASTKDAPFNNVCATSSTWPQPSASTSYGGSKHANSPSPAQARRPEAMSRVGSVSNLTVPPLNVHPSSLASILSPLQVMSPPAAGWGNKSGGSHLNSAPSTPAATPPAHAYGYHSNAASQQPSGMNTPTDAGERSATGPFSRSRSGSFVGLNAVASASASGGRFMHIPSASPLVSQRSISGSSMAGGGSGVGAGAGAAGRGDVWNLWSWPFVAPLEEMHVRGLVERVKQVNLLWYAEGTSLLIKAWEKLQQHNRWIAEHGTNAIFTTEGAMPLTVPASTAAASAGVGNSITNPRESSTLSAAHSRNSKRFFLPGHMQSDEVFTHRPTPYLQMAFHLAGLATNKYQQALKYALDDNLTLCNLSFLMSAVYTKYASAMSYLKRAVLANPHHVRSWYYLGQLYHYHVKDATQARLCYEKALSLAPHLSHANTLKDFGNLMQFSFNQPGVAEELYRKALQVEPRHIKSLQMLASLRVRNCHSLTDYDEVKSLLYNAARSPMGVVETRLHAQEKFLQFLTAQAEMWAEEHVALHMNKDTAPNTGAAVAGAAATGTAGSTAAAAAAAAASASAWQGGLTPELREAKKRWREAIDFLQCPHLHLGTARDAADDAGSASTTAAMREHAMVTLSLPSQAASQHLQHMAQQYLVTSTVIKPILAVVAPTVAVGGPQSVVQATAALTAGSNTSLSPSRSPSLSRTASEDRDRMGVIAGKGTLSGVGGGTSSATSAASTIAVAPEVDVSAPAGGFSFCVCADCCAVNSAALPLADTLLSYAQFIATFEAVPLHSSLNPTPAQNSAHIHARMVESAKYYQWSILVHHTLLAAKKKHKQAQMAQEMNPDALMAHASAYNSSDPYPYPSAAAPNVTGSPLLFAQKNLPNQLTKDGRQAYRPGDSSTAHEVLPSAPAAGSEVFPQVPPSIKIAFVFAPVAAAAASAQIGGKAVDPAPSTGSSDSPSLSAVVNTSLDLSLRAPWFSPAFLAGALGVSPNFHVVVSRPFPLKPKSAPPSKQGSSAGAAGEAQAEKRLAAMMASQSAAAAAAGAAGGVALGASHPQGIFSTINSPLLSSPAAAAASTAGSAPPSLSRPPSSWDNAAPKKWLTQTGPVSTNSVAATAAAQAAASAQIARELAQAEWELEVDLEFDVAQQLAAGLGERRCACPVDHAWGEAATACGCSFPSPRYLACYGFFLMRNSRPAAAAYVFQAAAALHPFGRTGSSLFARMLQCAARGGALVRDSPSYAATLRKMYSLWQKAVGFEPVMNGSLETPGEFAPSSLSSSRQQDSEALVASLTSVRLFEAFLKEHGSAVGPVVASAPGTPTAVAAAAAASTAAPAAPAAAPSNAAPNIGPVLSNVPTMQTRLSQLGKNIEFEVKARLDAYRSGPRDKLPPPLFALAHENKHCKCERPKRGKPCCCHNGLIKGMINECRSMRERRRKQKQGVTTGFSHQDAATQAQARRGGRGGGTWGGAGDRGSLSNRGGGRGGGRGGSHAGHGGGGGSGGAGGSSGAAQPVATAASASAALSAMVGADGRKSRDSIRGDRDTDSASSADGITSSSSQDAANAAAAAAPAPVGWAKVVAKSETVAVSAPRRTGSAANAIAAPGGPPTSTGSGSGASLLGGAGAGGSGGRVGVDRVSSTSGGSMHASTPSSSSTPSLATPVSSSPALNSLAAPQSAAMASMATLTLPPHVAAATSALSTPAHAAAAAAAPVPVPVAVIPHLPTSAWHAPPSVLSQPQSSQPPQQPATGPQTSVYSNLHVSAFAPAASSSSATTTPVSAASSSSSSAFPLPQSFAAPSSAAGFGSSGVGGQAGGGGFGAASSSFVPPALFSMPAHSAAGRPHAHATHSTQQRTNTASGPFKRPTTLQQHKKP